MTKIPQWIFNRPSREYNDQNKNKNKIENKKFTYLKDNAGEKKR